MHCIATGESYVRFLGRFCHGSDVSRRILATFGTLTGSRSMLKYLAEPLLPATGCERNYRCTHAANDSAVCVETVVIVLRSRGDAQNVNLVRIRGTPCLLYRIDRYLASPLVSTPWIPRQRFLVTPVYPVSDGILNARASIAARSCAIIL